MPTTFKAGKIPDDEGMNMRKRNFCMAARMIFIFQGSLPGSLTDKPSCFSIPYFVKRHFLHFMTIN